MGDTWQNQTALNLSEIQVPDLASTYYRKILLVLIKHGVIDTIQRQAGLGFFFKLYLLTQNLNLSIRNFLAGAQSMLEKLKSK